MKHAKVQLNYLQCSKAQRCLQHDEHAKDGSVIAEYILIENEEDLAEYEQLLDNAAGQQIAKCLHSPLFPDKVDHMLGAHDMGTQLLAVAHIEASAHQVSHPEPHILNNPLFRIQNAATRKIAILRKILSNGNKPLIGSAGGFMWYMPDRMEILSTYDKKPQGAPVPFLRVGHKTIVLENDWELPRESVRYLDKLRGWGNYSVIRGLRDYNHTQLVALLKQFKDNGGEEVFVYTTGLDVSQMFDYTHAILEAGLNKLVLYFTGGSDEKHVEYFEKFGPALNIVVLETLDGTSTA